ncbi:MAG TPA: hypothetical protein PKD83_04040, partial [Ignavibacteria bacterium]|nr:hypothetical protein [Ignavibacteria bacterium]
MASGILCFGSDVRGVRDYFTEFQDQLFEAENPGSIANKILFAMSMDESEKKARIKKQLEFISENFSREKELEMYEKFYKNVVSK